MIPKFHLEVVTEENMLSLVPQQAELLSQKETSFIGDKMATYNANWHTRKMSPEFSTGRFSSEIILQYDRVLGLFYAEQRGIIWF